MAVLMVIRLSQDLMDWLLSYLEMDEKNFKNESSQTSLASSGSLQYAKLIAITYP